jgi:uncharacterized protein YjbI with pentapeptide repeats
MNDDTLVKEEELDLLEIIHRGVSYWNDWLQKNPNVKPALAKADFQQFDLRGADLRWADLRGANLKRADLREADLRAADLRGANLEGADLRGADVEYTVIERGQLREARYNEVDLIRPIFLRRGFSIFTEDDSIEEAEALFSSARTFAESLGFEFVYATDWHKGSLWKGISAAIKKLVGHEAVIGRAEIAEHIFVGHKDLETTVELANAAAKLESAFGDKKGAVALDLGLFIFLKKSDDGGTYFKRLSVDERILLNNDPSLLRCPDLLFDSIRDMKQVRAKDVVLHVKDECSSERTGQHTSRADVVG